MSVELRSEEVERLLALGERFAKEGLTFDDVLLVPAESEVLPDEVSTRTRFTRGIELRSRSSRRRWTPSPRRALAIAWRARAASASSTGTCRSRTRPREVDKVKRSESGMIVDPVTLRPRPTASPRR